MSSRPGLRRFLRPLKPLLLPALSGLGGFRGWHRVRNRTTLTVFGLHRVLDPSDPRFRYSMPTWTVTPRLLGGVIDLIERDYHVVAIDAVLDAAAGRRALPPRAALITFDDGWADTVDTALPILRARGLPSLTFVVSGRVGARQGFWETEWYAALAAASATTRLSVFQRLTGQREMDPDLERAVEVLGEGLRRVDLAERFRLLADLLGGPVDQGGALMVSRDQLGEMIRGGMAIGSHSVTHEPMDDNPQAVGEIEASIRDLDEIARCHGGRVRCLSYPHGRYRADVVAAGYEMGATLQFASEVLITPAPGGHLGERLLGRVWIGRRLAGPDGQALRPETELDFFRRPVGHPSPETRYHASYGR